MYVGAMLGNNRKLLTDNISGGEAKCQALLDTMPTKELVILARHSDLTARVKEIADMTVVQVTAELEGEYNLEMDTFQSGDLYASTEKLEDAIPDWFPSQHQGWLVSLEDGSFLEWAKDFLLQDVRINLWIRYLEHKKKPVIRYGQYL